MNEDAMRGTAVIVPETGPGAYIGGLHAPNLPYEEAPGCGDWDVDAWWWNPNPDGLDGEGKPQTIELIGPHAPGPSPPIAPALRDARPSFAKLNHPAGQR